MAASLDRDGWVLESAQAYAEEAPDTFLIPSYKERSNLQVGQLVQLLFVIKGEDETGDYLQPERMWVEVRSRTPDGYEGELMSQPATPGSLEAGDTITFGPEHVAAVEE